MGLICICRPFWAWTEIFKIYLNKRHNWLLNICHSINYYNINYILICISLYNLDIGRYIRFPNSKSINKVLVDWFYGLMSLSVLQVFIELFWFDDILFVEFDYFEMVIYFQTTYWIMLTQCDGCLFWNVFVW